MTNITTPVNVFATEPFDFNTEYASAMIQEIAPNEPVRIVRLQTLMRMKGDAGRPQDSGRYRRAESASGDG